MKPSRKRSALIQSPVLSCRISHRKPLKKFLRNSVRKETTSRGFRAIWPGTMNVMIFFGSAASGEICHRAASGCLAIGPKWNLGTNGFQAIGLMPLKRRFNICPRRRRPRKLGPTLMHPHTTISGCLVAGSGNRITMPGVPVTGHRCSRIGTGFQLIMSVRREAMSLWMAIMTTPFPAAEFCLHPCISIRASTRSEAIPIHRPQ